YVAGPKFAAASLVIAPVVLAGYFQTAAALMDATFYIRRRTSTKLRLTLEATGVMLVLYVALIPPFAGIGAALATLGGFAFLALRTWRTTQRIFEVQYEWPRVAASLAIAVALWGMSRLLPSDGSAFVVRGFLLLTWPVLLWQFGLLTNEEKEYSRTSLRRLLSHLRPRQTRPAAPVTPRGDGGTVAAASRPAPARPRAGSPPGPDPTSSFRCLWPPSQRGTCPQSAPATTGATTSASTSATRKTSPKAAPTPRPATSTTRRRLPCRRAPTRP